MHLSSGWLSRQSGLSLFHLLSLFDLQSRKIRPTICRPKSSLVGPRPTFAPAFVRLFSPGGNPLLSQVIEICGLLMAIGLPTYAQQLCQEATSIPRHFGSSIWRGTADRN
jgi:hypothetical protein